jgi:hypothetical protein
MKSKKEDTKIKRKQASEAIKRADIESEMLARRNDRPVAVARPAVAPTPMARHVVPMAPPMVRPAVAPTAPNPAMDEMRNADLQRPMANKLTPGMKNGGAVKASRGDGIAQRGKTKGRIC